MPGLVDSLIINPEKQGEWDYQSPSALQIFNKYKKSGSFGFTTCKDLAAAIVTNIPEDVLNQSISKVELSKAGNGPDEKSGFYLNIFLKNEFVHQRIHNINISKNVALEHAQKAAEVT